MLYNEKVKRLTPKADALRELYLKSGNQCAYPNCSRQMMNENNIFLGQVCHIQAAEPGGARFNPCMTNDERRDSSNLILMCYEHHKIIDDKNSNFTVEQLELIKQEHERRFVNTLTECIDWTQVTVPTFPNKMSKFFDILDIKIDDGEKQRLLEIVREYINRYQVVPVGLRHFFSQVLLRIDRIKNYVVYEDFSLDSSQDIPIEDIYNSLSINPYKVRDNIEQLERFKIACHNEFESEYRNVHYMTVCSLDNDWPFWSNIMDFCRKTNKNISEFTINLNFSLLD